MSFGNQDYTDDPCRNDCAWLIENYATGEKACAIAILASNDKENMTLCPANTIPKKEE